MQYLVVDRNPIILSLQRKLRTSIFGWFRMRAGWAKYEIHSIVKEHIGDPIRVQAIIWTAKPNPRGLLSRTMRGAFRSHSKQKSGLLLLTMSFLLGSPSPSAFAYPNDHPAGTYQIDVLPISTSFGDPNVNPTEVQETIAAVSQIYSTLSGGKVKLVLRHILPLVASTGSIKNVTDSAKYFPPSSSTADSGFSGLISVEVTPSNSSLIFAGMQGGSNILLNEPFNLDSTINLAHEIGHYFGLQHSSSGTCRNSNATWTCTAVEYGDNSDFMGSYILGEAIQRGPTIGRLSATQLDNLGFLDQTEIAYADASMVTVLSSVYSAVRTGTKLLYIPIDNQNGYSVEFRPATDPEAALAQNQINVWNSNSYYPSTIPSYGVQVRLLAGITTQFQKDEPTIQYPTSSGLTAYGNENFSNGKTMVLSGQNSIQQGLNAGESLTLFDGTTIKVDSEDPNSGAKIEITRPSITTGPTVDESNTNSTISADPNANGSYSVLKTDATNYDWPKIIVQIAIPSDPIRLTSVQALLNGTVVKSLDTSQIYNSTWSRATSQYLTLAPQTMGVNRIQLVVTDAIGKSVVSDIAHYDLEPFVYPSIDPTNVLVDSITSSSAQIHAVQCAISLNGEVTLSLKGLVDGSQHITPGAGCNWTTFTLSGLKAAKTYPLSIEQVDQFGQTGLSTPVVFTTLAAPKVVSKKSTSKTTKKKTKSKK